MDDFGLNLHRIEKDVARCDRTYHYFAQPQNLEKLRNIMCTYVWLNLKQGYFQGMCDIAAPLLVIFDDGTYSFSQIKREILLKNASKYCNNSSVGTVFITFNNHMIDIQ